MSSSPAARDSAVALLSEAVEEDGVEITARRMFGEWGLYCDGLFFALVCDDRLFLKPTHAGRAAMRAPAEGRPYPTARPWLLPGPDDLDDPDHLRRLIRATLEALS